MTCPIPQEILTQLGGSKFIAMTGAKSFVGSENAISFRLPGTITKQNANAIRIALNNMDLYEIELMKIRNLEVKLLDKKENIFAEDLHKAFTEMTGLDTRL